MSIIEITEGVRTNWTNLLEHLRNVDDASRGNAIKNAVEPIDFAMNDKDYHRCVEYLLAVSRFAKKIEDETTRKKFCGFFSKKFHAVVGLLEPFLGTKEGDVFSRTFDLYHLLSLSAWGQAWQDGKRFKLDGKLFEQLSNYSDALAKPMHLEKSRHSYFNGGDIENAERVARLKSECIRSCSVPLASTQLPEELEKQIRTCFETRLSAWTDLPATDKFCHLVHDIMGVIPATFDLEKAKSECDDPLLLLMENSNVCSSILTDSHSGRTSNATSPTSSFLRNDENCYRTLQRYTLTQFTQSFKEWLCSEEEAQMEDGATEKIIVLHKVIHAIQALAFFSDSTLKGLEDGLVAYVNGYYRYSLSVLLPLFEAALRDRVLAEGVWVIKHKEVMSLEEYLVFETVLTKSSQIFDDNCIEFFHKWFSTKKGVGLNLRNDHCHGILSHESYCDWIATGTILSFIFLCRSKKSVNLELDYDESEE